MWTQSQSKFDDRLETTDPRNMIYIQMQVKAKMIRTKIMENKDMIRATSVEFGVTIIPLGKWRRAHMQQILSLIAAV